MTNDKDKDQYQADIAALSSGISDLEDELYDKELNIEDMEDVISDLQDELRYRDQIIVGLEEDIILKDRRIDDLTSELDRLRQDQ
jgi:predicted  nucleic acid-binding Zn-ribbon protein